MTPISFGEPWDALIVVVGPIVIVACVISLLWEPIQMVRAARKRRQ